MQRCADHTWLCVAAQPVAASTHRVAVQVVFVPPAKPDTLAQLWPHIPRVAWAHCFFAGVDSLAPMMPKLAAAVHLIACRYSMQIAPHIDTIMSPPVHGTEAAVLQGVPLTNGRGAFSDSLAEWVMCAALHFNKQVQRVPTSYAHSAAQSVWHLLLSVAAHYRRPDAHTHVKGSRPYSVEVTYLC
jgi:hypothetical protein